jgi:hypothetical protein
MVGKGSRPGERRGERKKGTPNKATTAASIQAEIAASGEKPLDYMLRVMRDETAEPDAMARAAAPYVHPTLAAVAHRHANADGTPIAPTVIVTIMQPPAPSSRRDRAPRSTVDKQQLSLWRLLGCQRLL